MKFCFVNFMPIVFNIVINSITGFPFIRIKTTIANMDTNKISQFLSHFSRDSNFSFNIKFIKPNLRNIQFHKKLTKLVFISLAREVVRWTSELYIYFELLFFFRSFFILPNLLFYRKRIYTVGDSYEKF